MSKLAVKIIFELTLAEREFSQTDNSIIKKFIKAIHVVASMKLSDQSDEAIFDYVESFFRKDICDEKFLEFFKKRILS